MPHSAWHPSRASGNMSGISVFVGIIGLAINPLLGIIAMGICEHFIREHDYKERVKQMKNLYGITYDSNKYKK